jgi:cytochrome c553
LRDFLELTMHRAFGLFAASLGLAGVLSATSVFAQAGGNVKPDLKRGQEIAAGVCAGCHGADGNSVIPANPKLAAQHADYLYKQLSNFKPGANGKPPERANAVMAAFALQLSDADMRHVSAYYASQTLSPASAKDKTLIEKGRNIYRAGIAEKGIPACAGCHGPTGAGMPSQYPRLQGQFADYTEAQLTAFRQGARNNNVSMSSISARMSDADIKAVSDYIAGLR